LFVGAALFLPTLASAHNGIKSGNAVANKSQEVVFGIGHGCEGADTVKIVVEVPPGVTSVRPMPGDFGKVSVEKDDTGAVKTVTWQKRDGDVFEADIAYYTLTLRMKPPNAPFTTLLLPMVQTCRNAAGQEIVTEWTAPDETEGTVNGVEIGPAPQLTIVPERKPGWNRFVVPAAIADLAPYFGDAQIVWQGSAAYSANQNTLDQIAVTPGVTRLRALAAGDEIWVKY
jgi:uncharacterized protein YcnI